MCAAVPSARGCVELAPGNASFSGRVRGQYVFEHLVLDEACPWKIVGIDSEDVSSMLVQHFRLMPVAMEHMRLDGRNVFPFLCSFNDNEFPTLANIDAISTDRA